MKRTLYEIGADAAALDLILDELQGDVSDVETAAVIDDWLRENTAQLETKADGYCTLISEYLARAHARQTEAVRLRDLATADENRAARLKERLHRFFEERQIAKLETPRYVIRIAKNGGLPPLIFADDLDVETLPETLRRVQITPDTRAIREAWARGETLDFVQIGERGTHLSIR